MSRRTFVALFVFPMLSLIAISGCSGGSEQVTGVIILPNGAAVPSGATINVQVQDTSRADAVATTMGEQVIDGEGQGSPIEFAVDYDPDEIVDNYTYTMSVRIEDGDGKLLFINDTAIPVITRDNPTSDVEVSVIAVGR